MLHLQHVTSLEQIVKKSRFLATAVPISDESEAKAAIARYSHADASHNCWAWRIGQAYRFSDDGEPSGTAGKPILAAIDGQSVDRVAIVVTRWFGGILLGSGGLVRAYGGAAAACLRSATLLPVKITVQANVAVHFTDLALVKSRLASFEDTRIVSENFTETGADLTIEVAEANLETISKLVSDLTRGKSRLVLPT